MQVDEVLKPVREASSSCVTVSLDGNSCGLIIAEIDALRSINRDYFARRNVAMRDVLVLVKKYEPWRYDELERMWRDVLAETVQVP